MEAWDGMHFNFIHLQSLHSSNQSLADVGNGSARKGEPTFVHVDDLRKPFLYSLYNPGSSISEDVVKDKCPLQLPSFVAAPSSPYAAGASRGMAASS